MNEQQKTILFVGIGAAIGFACLGPLGVVLVGVLLLVLKSK